MKRHLNWLFVILLLIIGFVVVWHYARYDYIYWAFDTSNLCDSWQEFNIYLRIIRHEPVPILWSGWKDDAGVISSALTTTRLPAWIQMTTHWHPEFVFRYFAIPIVIWLPVVVYLIAKKFVPANLAFVLGILFILQPNFRGAPGYARIVIAELFLSLSIYILLSKPKPKVSIPILTVLAAAITVTHYATAFITVPFLFGWAGILMWRRRPTLEITSFLLCILVFCVFWHQLVNYASGEYAQATIARAVPYLLDVSGTTNNAISKGMGLLGTFTSLNIWIKLQTVIIWTVEILSAAGLVINYKHQEILVAAVIPSLILISTGYWLPPVANGYGVGRIIFFASPVLLPHATLAAIWCWSHVRNIQKELINGNS